MSQLRYLLIALALGNAAIAATSTTRNLSEFFGGKEGCFVLYDFQRDSYVRYNPSGCAQRFSPCSTFKIPHTVIALHTGVASGPEFSLPWDGVSRGLSAWDRDQTLRSAFQNSVVWFFQELAQRIGQEQETRFVREFEYGNSDTRGGLTNFWLQSSLLISADEQVAFLRRLWKQDLPVSKSAQRSTREIMEVSRREARILYGKTGTGGDQKANVASLGWFVGCVESSDNQRFFAVRVTGKSDAGGRQARQIADAILAKLGI